MPGGAVIDPGAGLRLGMHQTFGDQDADGFTISGTRDFALIAGFDFAIQNAAGPQHAR